MKLSYFRWIRKCFKSLFFVIFFISIFFVIEKENNDVINQKIVEEEIVKSSKMSYTPHWSDSTIIQYYLNKGDAYNPKVDEIFISITLIDNNPVTIKWGDGKETICHQDDLYSHKYNELNEYYYVEISNNLKTFSKHWSTLHIFKSNEQIRRIERIASTLKNLSYFAYNAKNLYFVVDAYPSGVTDVVQMFAGAKFFNSPVTTLKTDLITNMYYMFSDTSFNQSVSHFKTENVTTMHGMFNSSRFNQPIDNFNTSNVVYMSQMFANSPFNQSLRNFDTRKVSNMRRMFDGAYNFNQPINNFVTSNVLDMSKMFANSPFNQFLNNFNTSKVTTMYGMFEKTTNFNKSLNSFDTRKVSDMSYMFAESFEFNQPLGNFLTSNVNDMSNMFSGAKKFNYEPRFNTTNVINMSNMFSNTLEFNQSLDKFDTSKVKKMSYMFSGAVKFNFPLDKFDTSNVTDMRGMFQNTSKFNQSLDKFDTSKVTTMEKMFEGAKEFNQKLDKFNTSNVTNMVEMFKNTLKFNQPLDKFETSNVTTMLRMFEGANEFNQKLDKFDTSNVKTMQEMFKSTLKFNQPLDKFDTSNVITMRGMFNNAKEFNQKIDYFDTPKLKFAEYMFANTLKFNQPLDKLKTSNVTNMDGMFYNAREFNQPLNNFNTANVINMERMFQNAVKFSQDISGWNFKSLINFSWLFLDSAITFDHYNAFIEKLADDKVGQKVLDKTYIQSNVTRLKRAKPNEIYYNFLFEFGFDIKDGGYYYLHVLPIITWKEVGYNYSFKITGAETEAEKNDFLVNIKHKEVMISKMKYFEPYGLSEEKYFIEYEKVRLIQPIDMKNAYWNTNDRNFVYNDEERHFYLENLPTLLKGKITYTDNKHKYPGTYYAEYFINGIDPLLYEIINPVSPKKFQWHIGKGVIDMKNVKWSSNSFIYNGKNHEIILDNLPIGVSASYTNNKQIEPGTYTATAEFIYVKAAYNLKNEPFKTRTWYIQKAPLSMRNTKWQEKKEFIWDGYYHEIEMIGYPSEVKMKYTNNNKNEPGKYTATVEFDYNENRYYLINEPNKNVIWYIIKEIDLKNAEWSLSEFKFDGTEKKIEIVNYASEINHIIYSGIYKETKPGTYTAYADFNYDKDKYKLINKPSRSISWSIFEEIDLANVFWKEYQYEYDGSQKVVELSGVPDKIHVTYSENKKTDEGEYLATARITWDKTKYRIINEPTNSFNWVIYQKIDLSDVKWNFKEFEYDDNQKEVKLENLPAKIKVTYSGNTAIDPNFYTAKADFDYNSNVYRVSNLPNNSLNWRIYKKIDLSDVKWNAEKFKYDGNEKEVYLNNDHIEVSFTYDANTATEPNRYKTFAKINYDNKKYIIENQPILYLNWQIYHEIDLKAVEWNFKEFKWDGTFKKVELLNLPDGVKMNYRQNLKIDLGSYVTTAIPDYDRNKYVLINEPEFKFNWMIYTEIDYSNVKWNQDSFSYDGKEKEVYLENLPPEIRVTYVGNVGKNSGSYLTKVSFLTDEKIYRPINRNISDLPWVIKDERIEVEAEKIEISEPTEVFEIIEEDIKPTVKETVNNPQLIMFVIIGFSVVVSYEIFTIIKIKRGFR